MNLVEQRMNNVKNAKINTHSSVKIIEHLSHDKPENLVSSKPNMNKLSLPLNSDIENNQTISGTSLIASSIFPEKRQMLSAQPQSSFLSSVSATTIWMHFKDGDDNRIEREIAKQREEASASSDGWCSEMLKLQEKNNPEFAKKSIDYSHERFFRRTGCLLPQCRANKEFFEFSQRVRALDNYDV